MSTLTKYKKWGVCPIDENYFTYLKNKAEFISKFINDITNDKSINDSKIINDKQLILPKEDEEGPTQDQIYQSINDIYESLSHRKPNYRYEKDLYYSSNKKNSWMTLLIQTYKDLPRCCLLVINPNYDTYFNNRDFNNMQNFYDSFMNLDILNEQLSQETIISIINSFNLFLKIFDMSGFVSDEKTITILRKILESNIIFDKPEEITSDKDEQLIYNKINYILSLLYVFAQQISISFATYMSQLQFKIMDIEDDRFKQSFSSFNLIKIFDIRNRQIINVNSFGLKEPNSDLIIPTHTIFSHFPVSNDFRYQPYVNMIMDFNPFFPVDFQKFIGKYTKYFNLWNIFKQTYLTQKYHLFRRNIKKKMTYFKYFKKQYQLENLQNDRKKQSEKNIIKQLRILIKLFKIMTAFIMKMRRKNQYYRIKLELNHNNNRKRMNGVGKWFPALNNSVSKTHIRARNGRNGNVRNGNVRNGNVRNGNGKNGNGKNGNEKAINVNGSERNGTRQVSQKKLIPNGNSNV